MPQSSLHRPKVALAFPVGSAHLIRALQGIKEYARTRTNWVFATNTESMDISAQSLKDWKGDGAIVVIWSEKDKEQASQLKIPFVSFSMVPECPDFHQVRVDHFEIGKMAAEHLISCGFDDFAFYGIKNSPYSQSRLAGFSAAIAPRKPFVRDGEANNSKTLTLDAISKHDNLQEWLSNLPKPIGLFAANDSRARRVADACQDLGIAIPKQMAIVGVDDNEVLCQFGSPTLTSIPCNRYEMGFKAAEVLDELMSGITSESRDIVVAPGEMVCRQSTDIGIYSNNYATEAHAFVRKNLQQAFGAEQVARELGITRRRLEQCIGKATGKTPYEFICSLRVDHAKQLIRQNTGTLQDIAVACGFRDARHLRKVFKKFMNQTPTEFRAEQEVASELRRSNDE